MCHQSDMAKTKKNAAAVALGRLGGLKGGKARAKMLTAERRREIAVQAVKARWAKRLELLYATIRWLAGPSSAAALLVAAAASATRCSWGGYLRG